MSDKDLTREAMLRDLDIQWRDHFHMRDQTWKSLQGSALLLLAVVGLQIRDPGDLVMIPAYLVLMLTAVFGWTVAAHHRVRQGQKFAFIKMYEKEFGLWDAKTEIIRRGDQESGIAGRFFTGRYIALMHASVGVVAAVLLINRLLQ